MIIAIDLGGMSAKGAVLQDGKLVGCARVKTNAQNSIEETVASLFALCKEVVLNAGGNLDEVTAVGIGSPGVIDSQKGEVVHWSNFSWHDVPLGKMLSEKIGKPVFVTNDANAAALGEAKYGAGKRFSDSVLITLGTGVGGGIILDGKLFEGYKSAGAELGHMVICKDGEPCSCGRRGCLEAYASATALMRMTKEEMQKNRESAMWNISPALSDVDGKTAFLAAEQGDASGQKVVENYVQALGEGIANIVNLLRPQAIVLGGGVSAQGEALLVPLRKYVSENIYVSQTYAPIEILCASLGNDAGLYGAGQYAADRLK